MNVEKEIQIIALDHIAAMVYQTNLNVVCMERRVMKLPPSPLKDVVILFVENQRSWLSKLMRGLKKIGLENEMQRDLSSEEIDYYSVICEFARQTKDMHAAADLMEIISKCEEIPDWMVGQIDEKLKPFQVL